MTIAVNRNLSNCENSPKKSFLGLQRDSNPWPGFHKHQFLYANKNRVNANLLRNNGERTRQSIPEAGQFIHCDGHILISFVFPQFTSFHSVFHSFHGLMNSINWPASSIWVFIAQLGEHCSANAEATGSNPVEAPKNFFSGYFRHCLNCDSLRWSHTNFKKYFICKLF